MLQESKTEPILNEHQQEVSGDSRSWTQRTFSPLKKESMRSGIFAMLMSAIGLGVFSFHKLMDEVGIIAALILIVVYGLFNLMCARFVIVTSRQSPESKSLGELVQHILGKQFLVFYDVILFLSLTTTLVAQLLAVADQIFGNFGKFIFELLKVPIEKQTPYNFIFWTVLVLGVLLLVVLLLDPASKMGMASLIAFIIFLGTALTAIFQTPIYYQANGHDLNFTNFSFGGYLHRCGLLIFAFNCIYNYYTVANNIDHPTETRLNKVFIRTFVVLILLFALLGLVFYLSLGPVYSKTVRLFINRPQIGSSDYAMFTFRSLFTLSLLVSFVLTVEPCKAITGRFFSKRTNHFVSAVLFSLVPAVIAAFFQDVTTVIGITGSALTTIVVFTTPALLALFSGKYDDLWQRSLLVLFLVYTLATGFYGSYLNAKDIWGK